MSLFKAPTIEETLLHAAKIGLPEPEAKKFWFYYDSKNWMVGKTQMSRWRSAIMGWKLRYEQHASTSKFGRNYPSTNQRNAGVAAAGSSYEELARAKLQKQNAQRQRSVEKKLDKHPPSSGSPPP